MSGLVRNLIDQVLKNMGEEERAQSVNYVTDRMVEKMDNQERVALLLTIIDRVMSNLSPAEREDLSSRVLQHVSGQSSAPADAAPTGADDEVDSTAQASSVVDPA